jgi:hypothetical protein
MNPMRFPKGVDGYRKADYSANFFNYGTGTLAFVMALVIGVFAVCFFLYPAELGELYANIFNGFKTNLQ